MCIDSWRGHTRGIDFVIGQHNLKVLETWVTVVLLDYCSHSTYFFLDNVLRCLGQCENKDGL